MYYCEPCRLKKEWPESIARSRGPCELCKKVAICWDRPSSSLPKPPEEMITIPKKDWETVQRVVRELQELMCGGAAPKLPGSEGVPAGVYRLARKRDAELADLTSNTDGLNEREKELGFKLDTHGMKHCPAHGLVGYGYCISCDGGVF